MFKNRFNIFLFLILAFFLYSVLPNMYHNYLKIKVLKKEKQDLISENEKLEKDISRIEDEIERLNDPFYVETLARERLNMIKKDEKIYRLVD